MLWISQRYPMKKAAWCHVITYTRHMEQSERTNLGHRGQIKMNQSRSMFNVVVTRRSIRPTSPGSQARGITKWCTM
jgi:hypothetical protein